MNQLNIKFDSHFLWMLVVLCNVNLKSCFFVVVYRNMQISSTGGDIGNGGETCLVSAAVHLIRTTPAAL